MKLDDEIKFGASAGEQLLVSIEANIVGVKQTSRLAQILK